MKYDKIKIAQEIARAVGGVPQAYTFRNHDNKLDLFIGENRPDDDLTTAATIGLSEYTIYRRINDKPLRVEIIGAADAELEYFPNIIADCGFNIVRGEYSISPGAVYPNIIRNYYPNAKVNHIFFTQPFLWELESFDFDEEYVTWLQAIPITEAELQFLEKHGAEVGAQKLEELFEEHQIDVYDFMRPSVV